MPQVVVLDVETTGKNPSVHHIVEAAGIIYDTDFGEVVGEFDTLVRPTRSIDAGATEKHGLRASDLTMAPTFEEIGPMLARIFHRRPVVSYNIGFDATILNNEFRRNKIDFELTQKACAYLPFGEPIKLEEAAIRVGYQLENWHTALNDARAALAISEFHGWDSLLGAAGRTEHLSNVPVRSVRTLSRFQAGLVDKFDLRRFSRLEEFRDYSPEEGYLLLLDEVLKDKVLTAEEISRLDSYAERVNLSAGMRAELNLSYFRALETAATRGGITPHEATILLEYADLLGVEVQIQVTEQGIALPPEGSLVCQTGDCFVDGRAIKKDEVKALVEDAGFVFTDELKKSDGVTLLLVADQGHESGKTRKADSWGIPVMPFEQFLNLTR